MTRVQIQSIIFLLPLYCRDQSLTKQELRILLSLELPCQRFDILVPAGVETMLTNVKVVNFEK